MMLSVLTIVISVVAIVISVLSVRSTRASALRMQEIVRRRERLARSGKGEG